MTTQEDHECRDEPVLSLVICSYCIQQTHTYMKSRPICALSDEFNMVSWKKRKGKSQDILAESKTDISSLLYTSRREQQDLPAYHLYTITISQQTRKAYYFYTRSHNSLAVSIYLSISCLIECLHVSAWKVGIVLLFCLRHKGEKSTRSTLLSQFCLPGSVFSRTDLTYFQSCIPHVFEREIRKRKDVMRARESYSCLSVGVLKGFLLSSTISKYHLSCIHFKYQL